jgi:hypothetical protein
MANEAVRKRGRKPKEPTPNAFDYLYDATPEAGRDSAVLRALASYKTARDERVLKCVTEDPATVFCTPGLALMTLLGEMAVRALNSLLDRKGDQLLTQLEAAAARGNGRGLAALWGHLARTEADFRPLDPSAAAIVEALPQSGT